MPASEQYAITSPAATRSTNDDARSPMSASSSRSMRFSMRNTASSLPVTRVSSAHTASADRSASSARSVMSPKLPMGVGHMMSLPAMCFLPLLRAPRRSSLSSIVKHASRLGKCAGRKAREQPGRASPFWRGDRAQALLWRGVGFGTWVSAAAPVARRARHESTRNAPTRSQAPPRAQKSGPHPRPPSPPPPPPLLFLPCPPYPRVNALQ